MAFKLAGKILEIQPTNTFGSSRFEKRIFLLEKVDDRFPETWKFELWQQNCSMIDHYNVGDYITCYFDIKGQQYERNGKKDCMNTLKVWNIEKDGKLFKEI